MHNKVVSFFYDYILIKKIFFLPLNLLKSILLYKENHNSSSEVKIFNVHITNDYIKKKSIFIKIQINNSRAVYTAKLANIINDNNFIESCEPQSLIKIGFLSKQEEINRINNCINKAKKPNSWIFNKKENKKISFENYYYSLANIDKIESVFIVKFILIATNKLFSLPLHDLLLDSDLLANIYPPDLIRLGYLIFDMENS